MSIMDPNLPLVTDMIKAIVSVGGFHLLTVALNNALAHGDVFEGDCSNEQLEEIYVHIDALCRIADEM